MQCFADEYTHIARANLGDRDSNILVSVLEKPGRKSSSAVSFLSLG